MKFYQIKKENKQVTLEYGKNDTRYNAMFSVISLFGRYLIDKGKGDRLLREMAALYLRNDMLDKLGEDDLKSIYDELDVNHQKYKASKRYLEHG